MDAVLADIELGAAAKRTWKVPVPYISAAAAAAEAAAEAVDYYASIVVSSYTAIAISLGVGWMGVFLSVRIVVLVSVDPLTANLVSSKNCKRHFIERVESVLISRLECRLYSSCWQQQQQTA